MGLQVNFELKKSFKNELSLAHMNKALGKLKLDRPVEFFTEAGNQEWLDDINTNPASPHRHLKPKDRALKMDELKDMFPLWTTPGAMQIDVGFSRTSERDMGLLLEFIDDHRDKFVQISNIDDLIERSETGSKYDHLKELSPVSKDVTYLLPEERRNKVIASNLPRFSSWGGKDQLYAAAFGNVDRPMFARAPSWNVDPSMNPLAVNEEGQHVILLPLLDMGKDIMKQVTDTYNDLTKIGVTESFVSFVVQVYGNMMSFKSLDVYDDLQVPDEAWRCMDVLRSSVLPYLVEKDGRINVSRLDNTRSDVRRNADFIMKRLEKAGYAMRRPSADNDDDDGPRMR